MPLTRWLTRGRLHLAGRFALGHGLAFAGRLTLGRHCLARRLPFAHRQFFEGAEWFSGQRQLFHWLVEPHLQFGCGFQPLANRLVRDFLLVRDLHGSLAHGTLCLGELLGGFL